MKNLLINGCSFGYIWSPQESFVQSVGCDVTENISKPGTSFQRTARSTVEWVAQNGKPGMIMIPITFAHRWEMPIGSEEDFDTLDGNWLPLQVNSAMDKENHVKNTESFERISEDKAKIQKLTDLYFGLIKSTVGYWDKLFTEIIMLSSFLEQQKIPYLMFDMCNDFDESLLIDHTFLQKAQLIKQNKNVINIFSFCGNKYMWRLNERDPKEPFNQHWGSDEYRLFEAYILQYIRDNEVLP